MTQEDLNQIRAVMREEVRAGVREEVRAIVREEVRAIVREETAAPREEFAEKLGAAAVSFVTSLSELRNELGVRLDALDRRMVSLEHRMDRRRKPPARLLRRLPR